MNLMKILIYFKNDLFSKELFQEKILRLGLENLYWAVFEKKLLRRTKILAFNSFFQVCWLSARVGVPKWALLASADMLFLFWSDEVAELF